MRDNDKTKKQLLEELAELRHQIAELKKSANQLQNKEKYFKKKDATLSKFQHISGLGTWEWDIHSNKQVWSDEMYKIFGMKKEGTIPDFNEGSNLIHPDDRDMISHSIENTLRTNAPYNVEFRIVRADGAERILHSLAEILYNESDEPNKLIGTTEDVTERRQTENALLESERRFRILFEQAAVGVAEIVSETGQFVRINPRYCDIVGYTIDEMQSLTFKEITHPDDLQEDLNNMALLLKGEIREFSLEKRYFHKNGSIVWVHLRVSPMWKAGEKPYNHIAIVEEITERKQKEAKIKRQQFYLEKAQEIGAIGTWELDILKNILTWTDQNYQNFGIPLGTPLTYESFLNQVHPDDRDYVHREWMAAIEGKPYDIEHRLIIDGNIRWVREKADVTFDEEGNGIYAIGFTQDITDIKQAVEALKEKTALNEQLLNSIPHPAMLINTKRIVQAANKIVFDSGVKVGDYCWKEFGNCEYLSDEDKKLAETNPYDGGIKCIFCLADEAMKGPELKSMNDPEVYAFGKIWDTYWEPVDKDIFLHYAIDITDRKKMEDELRNAKKEIEKWNRELEARVKMKTSELEKSQNLLIQSEKLTAMGKMAGGLAHELNSPLAGLLPMLELHKKRAKPGSREEKELALMLKTADHMAKIVKDFGVFSRKSKSEFRALSLNEVIEDTLSFSAVRLRQKGIKIKKDLSARLPLIRGDKTELQQVVLNMITNAFDAMNEGGRYLITTAVSEDSNKAIMVFTDDGNGIAKENLNKIFDPFFTTKKEGEGTGLGLSVSYGIIENHNGNITVESEPGKGTRFSVYLPALK